jgi:putative ABC transport system permease protein
MNTVNLKILFSLALKAFWFRKKYWLFVIFLISLNFTLSLSFERLRQGLSSSFTGVISGVDLLVGAPTSPLNLVLYTLFNMGSASQNIEMKTYEKYSQSPLVRWALPFSLGDSHRGYRVMGTNPQFFQYYQYGESQSLEFFQGEGFHKPFQTVVGFEVARTLGYQLGQKLVLSHGSSGQGFDSFVDHEASPFTLVGILKKTGTPLDHTIWIDLKDFDSLHGHQEPQALSAFFLKLHSRIDTLKLQREINIHSEESLLAVIPTVVLSQLWSNLDFFEEIFFITGLLILFVSSLALLFIFQIIFQSRLAEVRLLKVMGVPDFFVGLFFAFEMGFVFLLSLGLSIGIDVIVFHHLGSLLLHHFGLWISDVSSWQSLMKPLLALGLGAFFLNFILIQWNLRSSRIFYEL